MRNSNWGNDGWNLEALKRRHLVMCLIHTGGNVHQAGRLLGINSKSIRNMAKHHQLEKFLILLRMAVSKGAKINRLKLDNYWDKNRAYEGIVDRSLCHINHAFDADLLLKEIVDLNFVYNEYLHQPCDEEEVSERRALKENEISKIADNLCLVSKRNYKK